MAKIRLAFNLGSQEEAYRAAASRIRDVSAAAGAAPDALVASSSAVEGSLAGIPILLVDSAPTRPSPTVFPAFPWRFAPEVEAVRESLDAGELGEPGLFRMHVWSPPSAPGRGAAKMAAVDLALWLFGREPEVVHGVSPRGRSALIHLGFPGGGMAMLDFTDDLNGGEGYRSFSLIGSRGAAHADDHRDRNLVFAGGAPGASAPGSADAFIRPMLEDFIDAVRDGCDPADATRDYQKAEAVVRRAGLSEA